MSKSVSPGVDTASGALPAAGSGLVGAPQRAQCNTSPCTRGREGKEAPSLSVERAAHGLCPGLRVETKPWPWKALEGTEESPINGSRASAVLCHSRPAPRPVSHHGAAGPVDDLSYSTRLPLLRRRGASSLRPPHFRIESLF